MPYKDREQQRIHQRAYYAAHKDEIKAKAKAWDLANAERKKQRLAEYRAKNKERIRQYSAERYAANAEKYKARSKDRYYKNRSPLTRIPRTPERNRQYHAAWRKKSKAKIRAAFERYYAKHRDELRAKAMNFRQESRDEWLAQSREYRRRTQHMRNAAHGRRRALKKQNAVGDPAEVAAFYKWVRSAVTILCHHCGRPVPRGKRHVDHLIPLKRGGAHAVENLVPSCERCNCRKGAKLLT